MSRIFKKSGIAKPYEWWNDEELIKELDKRSDDMKTGNDKGVLWEELKRKF